MSETLREGIDWIDRDQLRAEGVTTLRGAELVAAAMDWGVDYGMFEVRSLVGSLAEIEREARALATPPVPAGETCPHGVGVGAYCDHCPGFMAQPPVPAGPPTPLPIVGIGMEEGRYSHVNEHPCGACQSYAFEFGFQSAREAGLATPPAPAGDEREPLATLLEREFAAMGWPNVNTTNSDFIADRLLAAGVRLTEGSNQ